MIATGLLGTQAPPPTWVVAATAVLAALLVLVPEAWARTRHVVTIAHEAAHGVAALLTGRRLRGIRLHSDSSGVTLSRGRPTGPGMVLTAAAGYVGPGLLGLGAAALLAYGHAVALLWAALALLTLLLLQIRNWFGLWSVLVAGSVVAVVSWWATSWLQSVLAYLLTWFLLLAAPRAVLDLQSARRRGRGRGSDADQLGRLTHLPAIVWVAVFLVGTLAALVLGVAWLLPVR